MRQVLKVGKIMFKYARKSMVINLMIVIVAALMPPLSLFLTQNVIDYLPVYMNGEGEFLRIVFFVLGLLLAMILSANINLLNETQKIQMLHQLNQNFTPIIIDKYRKIDYVCFEDSKIQDTLSRMGNNPQEKVLDLYFDLMSLLSKLISIIGLTMIFSQISFLFSLLFIIILVFIMWLDYKAINMMNSMFNGQTQAERRLFYFSSLLTDKKSLFELRLFEAVDYIQKKWYSVTSEVLSERLRTTIKSQKYFLVSSVCVVTWIAFVIFSLISAIQNDVITLGIFISLIGSAGSILNMAETLSYTFSNLSQKCLQMKHYEIFMALPEIQMPRKNKEINVKDPIIRFENIFFKYPDSDEFVLNGITFAIYPNERLALVGENGAGKSTIIKLLCRLYQPQKGRITVNDVDIQKLTRAQLRQVYSVVFQDFMKYELSLRENVALGHIEKLNDDESLLQALKMTMASQIGNNIDMNLGKIEEDGVDLSGGQWQRIAISRAVLANSYLTILDEPTAALDPIAESQMYESFHQLIGNRGCLMISHRLASAKICDRILVLSEGRVIEEGSHATLMESSGYYAKMFLTQSKWYKEKGGEKVES